MPWPQGKLLRASVNNFGYGGTNAHAILESAPASIAKTPGRNNHINGLNGVYISGAHRDGIQNGTQNGDGHANPDRSHVFFLSAKDSVARQTMMGRFAAHLATTMPSASDLAYTLAHWRSMHSWVAAVRARTINEMMERLQDPRLRPSSTSKRPRLAFVFNGQGAQWHAMGRELIDAYPVFGRSIREADDILKEYGASWSLRGMYEIYLRRAALLLFILG